MSSHQHNHVDSPRSLPSKPLYRYSRRSPAKVSSAVQVEGNSLKGDSSDEDDESQGPAKRARILSSHPDRQSSPASPTQPPSDLSDHQSLSAGSSSSHNSTTNSSTASIPTSSPLSPLSSLDADVESADAPIHLQDRRSARISQNNDAPSNASVSFAIVGTKGKRLDLPSSTPVLPPCRATKANAEVDTPHRVRPHDLDNEILSKRSMRKLRESNDRLRTDLEKSALLVADLQTALSQSGNTRSDLEAALAERERQLHAAWSWRDPVQLQRSIGVMKERLERAEKERDEALEKAQVAGMLAAGHAAEKGMVEREKAEAIEGLQAAQALASKMLGEKREAVKQLEAAQRLAAKLVKEKAIVKDELQGAVARAQLAAARGQLLLKREELAVEHKGRAVEGKAAAALAEKATASHARGGLMQAPREALRLAGDVEKRAREVVQHGDVVVRQRQMAMGAKDVSGKLVRQDVGKGLGAMKGIIRA